MRELPKVFGYQKLASYEQDIGQASEFTSMKYKLLAKRSVLKSLIGH